MTQFDEARLAELLCARLCHDLAGPLGAVSAGAELLEDGAEDPEALAMLQQSAAALTARMKFLRLALGQGVPPADGASLQALTADFLAASPTTAGVLGLDWSDEAAGQEWTAAMGKLALNLVILGRDALARGGKLTVRRLAAGQGLELRAEGKAASLGEAGKGLDAGSAEGLSPRAAQGYYTRLLAGRAGIALRSTDGSDTVTIISHH